MNLVAMGIVALNIAVAVALYYGLNGRIELPMMVGILCGAVTNTPGLGAANEALSQLNYNGPQIAMGYACAYPLGVLGIIGSIIAIRYICQINLKKEEEDIAKEEAANPHLTPRMMHLEVHNEALAGKTLLQVRDFMGRDFEMCRKCIRSNAIGYENAVSLNRMVCLLFKGYFKTVCDDGIKEEEVNARVRQFIRDIEDLVRMLAKDLKGYKAYQI